MPETNTPDPQKGGRYVRNADGTLTQIHATEDAPMRDKREAAAAPAPSDISANTTSGATGSGTSGQE